MKANLTKYRRRIDDAKALRQENRNLIKAETAELEKLTLAVAAAKEAQEIIQAIAQTIQQRAHQQISEVVTRCLDAVFEDPYTFRIDFERKRGKTEARLVFSRDGVELDDPANEIGGGVVDVSSLALRIAVIMLSRPARRRFVVLDEPFKYVRGKGNQARTRDMLTSLAEELGFQFLINTDITAYRLGKIVETGHGDTG